MAHPTSADGLDYYHSAGGNCLYLHDEGDGIAGRQETGRWLAKNHRRSEFFLCAQICHDQWDETASQPIDRFNATAVAEDLASNLELIGIDHLNLAILSDNANSPVEPVIEALHQQIAAGTIRAYGACNNWSAERIRQANAYALSIGGKPMSAVFTTELALARATQPLWPEYVSFNSLLHVVQETGMAVFAYVGDLNQGQCLFGDADSLSHLRPQWLTRWNHPENAAVVRRVRELAESRGCSTRQVNAAYVLNQRFPVIGVVSLSSFRGEFEEAGTFVLSEAELARLHSY